MRKGEGEEETKKSRQLLGAEGSSRGGRLVRREALELGRRDVDLLAEADGRGSALKESVSLRERENNAKDLPSKSLCGCCRATRGGTGCG
jgi:hypothetical protein